MDSILWYLEGLEERTHVWDRSTDLEFDNDTWRTDILTGVHKVKTILFLVNRRKWSINLIVLLYTCESVFFSVLFTYFLYLWKRHRNSVELFDHLLKTDKQALLWTKWMSTASLTLAEFVISMFCIVWHIGLGLLTVPAILVITHLSSDQTYHCNTYLPSFA